MRPGASLPTSTPGELNVEEKQKAKERLQDRQLAALLSALSLFLKQISVPLCIQLHRYDAKGLCKPHRTFRVLCVVFTGIREPPTSFPPPKFEPKWRHSVQVSTPRPPVPVPKSRPAPSIELLLRVAPRQSQIVSFPPGHGEGVRQGCGAGPTLPVAAPGGRRPQAGDVHVRQGPADVQHPLRRRPSLLRGDGEHHGGPEGLPNLRRHPPSPCMHHPWAKLVSHQRAGVSCRCRSRTSTNRARIQGCESFPSVPASPRSCRTMGPLHARWERGRDFAKRTMPESLVAHTLGLRSTVGLSGNRTEQNRGRTLYSHSGGGGEGGDLLRRHREFRHAPYLMHLALSLWVSPQRQRSASGFSCNGPRGAPRRRQSRPRTGSLLKRQPELRLRASGQRQLNLFGSNKSSREPGGPPLPCVSPSLLQLGHSASASNSTCSSR